MFTNEEADLLRRMIRVVAWTAISLAVLCVACYLARR